MSVEYTKTLWQDLPSTTSPLSAANLNKIEKGIADSVDGVNANAHDIAALTLQISGMSGGVPPTASSTAGMDTTISPIWVNTTDGYWYYYNGSAWVAGGEYGGAVTDTTLSIEGAAADAKAVGDALAEKADADDMDDLDDRVTAVESDVSDLKADLGDYSFNTPVSYKDFVKGYQLQRYHVGQSITFKADATNQRAITTTPIYFPRKTFLAAPNEYEFFLCVVTSKTDFTVLVENSTYYTHDWVQAKTYIMLQVRRKDKVALTDADMGIINSWIDFQYKTFESDDLKRLCALKKQFYSGNGSNYSNNHNLFLIAHITDIHADVQRYANFRKFVDDNASVIDCALCTGDYVDNQNDEQWTAMNEVSGNVDVLQVVGNHDAGNQAGDTLIGDVDLVTKFSIETNTGKMYYYVDYDEIRIIVLNQFEGSTRGTYVYNNDEITWLLSILDDSITNSKHVIIACHIPDTFPVGNNKGFYQRYNKGYPQYPTMNSGLEDVINAFKHGTSVTTTLSGNINVNHTFSSAGDFVCWICGHYHGDFIGYSTTYSDQLYLNGNCGVCQPAPFKYTFMGETFSDLARIPKTVSEDCFNAYAFDFKERLVKVVKIGADMNDILQPRQVAVYDMDGEQGNQ